MHSTNRHSFTAWIAFLHRVRRSPLGKFIWFLNSLLILTPLIYAYEMLCRTYVLSVLLMISILKTLASLSRKYFQSTAFLEGVLAKGLIFVGVLLPLLILAVLLVHPVMFFINLFYLAPKATYLHATQPSLRAVIASMRIEFLEEIALKPQFSAAYAASIALANAEAIAENKDTKESDDQAEDANRLRKNEKLYIELINTLSAIARLTLDIVDNQEADQKVPSSYEQLKVLSKLMKAILHRKIQIADIDKQYAYFKSPLSLVSGAIAVIDLTEKIQLKLQPEAKQLEAPSSTNIDALHQKFSDQLCERLDAVWGAYEQGFAGAQVLVLPSVSFFAEEEQKEKKEKKEKKEEKGQKEEKISEAKGNQASNPLEHRNPDPGTAALVAPSTVKELCRTAFDEGKKRQNSLR